MDTLISGLQGTFIYSLTVALSFEEKPLAYLEEKILNDHGFSKHLPLFRQLLDLTLEHSTRRYVAYQLEGVDRSVLPPVVPRFDAKGGGEEHQLFMHCRSHWVLKPGQQSFDDDLVDDYQQEEVLPASEELFDWTTQPEQFKENEKQENDNQENENPEIKNLETENQEAENQVSESQTNENHSSWLIQFDDEMHDYLVSTLD